MSNISHNNWNINIYKTLDSTNLEIARRINSKNFSESIAVLSYEQTNGRGRYGNTWFSPPGNFYFSFLLHSKKTISNNVKLVFLLAIVVCEAIIKTTNKNILPRIKWPNDILINKKKIAGILLENYINNKGTTFIIAGIGINIDSHPTNTSYPATNLFLETNKKYDLIALAKILLNEFDNLIFKLNKYGFSLIRKKWMSYSIPQGTKIKVKINYKNKKIGFFRGIDNNGALILEGLDGKVESFSSTEIIEEILF